KAGIEVVLFDTHLPYRDFVSEDAIERSTQPLCVRRNVELERHHLMAGVYAPVGAAGACGLDPATGHPLQSVLDFTLDGAQPGLSGKAVKAGPVVGQVEPDDGHLENGSQNPEGDPQQEP